MGGLAIVFGAFGAHALKQILDAQTLSSYQTAVDYQMYHAFFLLILGFFRLKIAQSFTAAIYYSCLSGVVLFSGSIYFLCLNKHFLFVQTVKWIALITPIGGLLLLISWILLAWYVIKNKSEFSEFSIKLKK